MLVKRVHAALVSKAVTRRFQTRFIRMLKSTMGCPDAYGDLIQVVRRNRVSAILDVGAHHGLSVRKFIDEVSTPIHAFEPTPHSFRALQKKYGNHPQVTLHNIALSIKNDLKRFYVNENSQTNSLLERDIGNVRAFEKATTERKQIEVQCMRLDDWCASEEIDGPLVVKADIQGAEGLFLEGGRQTFRKSVIAFYSEAQLQPMYKGQVCFTEINELMTDYGFYLHNVYPCMHDAEGRALQLDAFWIKNHDAE